jgi:hypothetical protein
MSCALNHVIARDHITLYHHLVEHPLFEVFETFEFCMNVDKGFFQQKNCVSEHFE